MNLTDAALRARAREIVEVGCHHVSGPFACADCLVTFGRALRDATRAEQREARMLYREAVTILLECAHGDEQTCGCKDRALERLAAIRAQGREEK